MTDPFEIRFTIKIVVRISITLLKIQNSYLSTIKKKIRDLIDSNRLFKKKKKLLEILSLNGCRQYPCCYNGLKTFLDH